MSRITTGQLEGAFARYIRALHSAGLSGYTHVELHHVSKSEGLPYTVYSKLGFDAEPIGLANGFLGWTAREAMSALGAIAKTLEDVAHLNGEWK